MTYNLSAAFAVIAENTWAAIKGRRRLKVEWDHGPNGSHRSDEYKEELQHAVRQPGKVVRNVGDVDSEFRQGWQDRGVGVLRSATCPM